MFFVADGLLPAGKRALAAALITFVPRLRRLAAIRIRPHLVRIWADLKTIATEPRKLANILAGAVLSQVLVAMALGGALTSAGVPQEQAVAAVFIQRLFTGYLPPVWGWVTLAWMRRREYV